MYRYFYTCINVDIDIHITYLCIHQYIHSVRQRFVGRPKYKKKKAEEEQCISSCTPICV